MDRSGPVPAAVRAAGYVSEDDEDDEEDGSSVEEEDEYEEAGDETAAANTHANASAAPALGATPAAGGEEIPGYSAPGKSSGIEIGNNGYATEKKAEQGVSGTPAAGEPSQDASKGKTAEGAAQ